MFPFEEIQRLFKTFWDEQFHLINKFSGKIFEEFSKAFETYKKIGEEDHSQEAEKIREGLKELFLIWDKVYREFDVQFTEFLIESQKNFENIMQLLESFLKEGSLQELQMNLMDFTHNLKNYAPEHIINFIESLFIRPHSANSYQNDTKQKQTLEEELNITFSESDTHIKNSNP